MQLEAGAIRRVIAFPMASADPQAKSDRPAAADARIATRGTRSCPAGIRTSLFALDQPTSQLCSGDI